MNKLNLNESTVYNLILERFGEPIGDAPPTVGVPDERNIDESSINLDESARRLDESARRFVGQQEILEMWETLYEQLGQVNIEELASWLGTSESAIRISLPHRLRIDENDEIIEKVLF